MTKDNVKARAMLASKISFLDKYKSMKAIDYLQKSNLEKDTQIALLELQLSRQEKLIEEARKRIEMRLKLSEDTD